MPNYRLCSKRKQGAGKREKKKLVGGQGLGYASFLLATYFPISPRIQQLCQTRARIENEEKKSFGALSAFGPTGGRDLLACRSYA